MTLNSNASDSVGIPVDYFPSQLKLEQLKSLGKQTRFLCQRCEVCLEVGTLNNEGQVCFCSNCHGFIIGQESLAELVHELEGDYPREHSRSEDLPQSLNADELNVKIYCPACHKSMDKNPYDKTSEVAIDSCHSCKLAWLDRGKLSQIVRSCRK